MYGRVIQTIGIIAVLIAIGISLWQHASIPQSLATAGAVAFAIGTKLVYYSK